MIEDLKETGMLKKTKQKKPAARRTAPAPVNGERGLFEPIYREFRRLPGIAESRMFGSVGLKVDNKVFAMLVKDRLVVKLPKDRVDSLIAGRDGKHFDPGHGRLMKEWVAVRAMAPKQWIGLAREAMRFVAAGER